MERTINLKPATGEFDLTDVTGKLPENTKYPLNYAKAELLRFRQGTILSQYYTNYLLFMELYQINLTEPLQLDYQVNYSAMFLCCDLDAGIRFTTIENEPVYETIKGTYYATHNLEGRYTSVLPAGDYYFLYITPRAEWLKKSIDNYPRMQKFVEIFESGIKPYNHLPRFRIDSDVEKIIMLLLAVSAETAKGLKARTVEESSNLFVRYMNTLELQGDAPDKTPEEKGKEIRQYIDANFTIPEIENLTMLADHFNTSERTLTRLFLNEAGHSIHEHVKRLRMNMGMELLQQTNYLIRKIAHILGYRSASHFTYVFSEHFGFPPKDARKG